MADKVPANVQRVLGAISGSAAGAGRVFKADALRRSEAKNILTPEHLGGEAVVQALVTTLGGQIRPITTDDLRQFRRIVGQLKAKATKNAIRGGITPAQTIKLSAKDDIRRAQDQIKTAVLAGGNKGMLRFVTNAGPDSDVAHHHVHVELTSWSAAASSPRKPKELAKWVANQACKFNCDCGRHTYWYRYIATIGGWNQGRDETGFPKIRNPKLQGVACKHVLKVMRELMSNTHIHAQIAKMIEKGAAVVVRQADAKAMAKPQARRVIESPAASARAARLSIALSKGLAGKRPAELVAAKTREAATRAMERQVARLKQMGMLPKEIAELVAAMAKAMEKS